MPMKISYHTVGGQVTGQSAGATRTHFLSDALGSVTAIINDAGIPQNTYRYKPYGGILAKSGNMEDPGFLWIGALGYRRNNASATLYYVRARHYFGVTATWNTIDPISVLYPYGYARCAPLRFIDPSGTSEVSAVALAFINVRLAQSPPKTLRPMPPGGATSGKWGMYYNGKFWLWTEPRTWGQPDRWARTDRNFTVQGAAVYTPYKTALFAHADSEDLGGSIVAGYHTGRSAEILVDPPAWTFQEEAGTSGDQTNHVSTESQGKCYGVAKFNVQACTPFLPWFLQTEPNCINMEGWISFTGRNNVVTILISMDHDKFPDFEYLVLSPPPIKSFYQYKTPFEVILEGGLGQKTSGLGVISVNAKTAECCNHV